MNSRQFCLCRNTEVAVCSFISQIASARRQRESSCHLLLPV